MRPESGSGGQPTRTFIEEARRAQIISYAVRTIAELGYAKASLAQIAKRAGISKGVISYHFAGKDELIEQVVADIYTRGGAYIVPRIMAESTASGMLRAYLNAHVDFINASRTEIVALTEIFLNHRTAEGRQHYDVAGNDVIVQPLADLLRTGQQDGEFRDFDAWIVAMMIRDLIDGISGKLVGLPDFDIEAYRRQLIDLVEAATHLGGQAEVGAHPEGPDA